MKRRYRLEVRASIIVDVPDGIEDPQQEARVAANLLLDDRTLYRRVMRLETGGTAHLVEAELTGDYEELSEELIVCECLGGDPCDCPDCDHERCSYKGWVEP